MAGVVGSSGPVVIVGNPFYPTGRGRTVFGFLRALRACHVPVLVCDAYSRWAGQRMEPWLERELQGITVERPGGHVNIYHVNGDEVDAALHHLQHRLPDGAFNIIYPFWELSEYPSVWAERLDLFDEIWAPTRFIADSLRERVQKLVVHMPLSLDFKFQYFLGREYFGLSNHSYLFLFLFDFRSYVDRKNPAAAIDVFESLCRARPDADVRLVLKVQGGNQSPQTRLGRERFLRRIEDSPVRDRIIVLDLVLNDNETKNLVRCCDCFVSLHRSEGLGLGLAEAMYLGKPVIATAYSGNMDFTTRETAFLVDYRLIPVQEGQYPFFNGQVWAEPDLAQAAAFAIALVDDPQRGYALGQLASRHIRVDFSSLAMGLRYQERLEEIAKDVAQKGRPAPVAQPAAAKELTR